MAPKKTKRKASTRKTPANRVKRANAKTAAQTRKPARPTNGTLSIGGALKARLSELAKSGGQHANWKQFALSLLDGAKA